MKNITLNISYWTYPSGYDFEYIDTFKEALSKECNIEIFSDRSEDLDGGLYEFVVDIVADFIFLDFMEGEMKNGAGYFWKPIFDQIDDLFSKNKNLKPDIEVARFRFKDMELFIYPLYAGSVIEVIDEVMVCFSRRYLDIQDQVGKTIKSIHIPIFHRVDTFAVCAYRVKLKVDEKKPPFCKSDYLKRWGIRCDHEMDYVFDLETGKAIKSKFYTQKEFDALLKRNFK